jgi:beta-lactamase class A
MTETWSALITDEHGHVLLEQEPDAVLSIASVGKLLLLIAVAERYDDAELARTRVSRSASAPVADSGLWQHLNSESLSLRDLVVLVSAVSDNWATNALLSQVGLEAVRECAVRWGMDQTQLLDIVRDERDPRDETCAPRLAQGTARELCALVRSLHSSPPHSPGARLVSWLRTNTDLSLVASAIGLDPLAHADPLSGVSLWN